MLLLVIALQVQIALLYDAVEFDYSLSLIYAFPDEIATK